MSAASDLFDQVVEYPDRSAAARFEALVGIDDIKARLITEASVLINPALLRQWSTQHHGSALNAVEVVTQRAPLIVLAGDVGTGKTELAESVGDAICRSAALPMLTLYPLSLAARGQGLVGEMTTLISRAFEHVRSSLGSARTPDGRVISAGILLIDEADALAQSRELAQMHHEDRAGVNALIRGIDALRRDRVPMLTIMCTNRAEALDPAVLRRAARVFTFTRPSVEQTASVLREALNGARLNPVDIQRAATALQPTSQRAWGATYSDLRQRFVPDVILDAYSRRVPLTGPDLVQAAAAFTPTRPFGGRHD